jgi:hypothetical protein
LFITIADSTTDRFVVGHKNVNTEEQISFLTKAFKFSEMFPRSVLFMMTQSPIKLVAQRLVC